MNRRFAFACVTAGALGGLAMLGSCDGNSPSDVDAFDVARSEFRTVLASLDARIDRLPVALTADSVDPTIVPAQLRDRRDRIAAKLDSLSDDRDSQRLGALAGLRASIADLEYRVDLAELTAATDVATTDSLLRAWLAEADDRLASAERLINDTAAGSGYVDQMRDAREEYDRLDVAFGSIRSDTLQTPELSTRRDLGEDLALVRRHVRATTRAVRLASR